MDPGFWWWGPPHSMFWIFPLLCMIFMVAIMVLIFRRGAGGCMPMLPRRGDSSDTTRETPREILDRRFASGELSREEYTAMKRDLAA